MFKKEWGFLFFIFLFGFQIAEAAPPLRLAGSSAIFPFAARVAEYFHYKTQEPTPLIEGLGTGAGIKLFCEGTRELDGVMASRLFKETERKNVNNKTSTFRSLKLDKMGWF